MDEDRRDRLGDRDEPGGPPLAAEDPQDDAVEEAARRFGERYPGEPRFRALAALVRGYAVVVRGVEAQLRPLGLSLSRFELLLLLSFARSGRLSMTRIRDLLMVHGSSVTYLVERLEEAGLVEREVSASDRRISLVRLTVAGRSLVERAARRLAEGGFGPFAGLEDERLGQLADLLGELRRGAPEPGGPAPE